MTRDTPLNSDRPAACDWPGCDRPRLYGGIRCPDHYGKRHDPEDTP